VPLACLEEGCGWQSAAATRGMARYHASKAHGNGLVRMVLPTSTEEIRERNRQRRRARYAHRKEQRQVSKGERGRVIRLRPEHTPHVISALVCQSGRRPEDEDGGE
jgi:hypothetical protein